MSKASRQAYKTCPNNFITPEKQTLYLHKRERVKGDPKLLEQKVYQIDFLSTCIACKNSRPDEVGKCKTTWCKMYPERMSPPKLVKNEEEAKKAEVSTCAEIIPPPEQV